MRVRSPGRHARPDPETQGKRRLRDRFDSSRQGAELFEGSSALPVISLVLREAALDDCARDRLVVDTLRDRVAAGGGKPRDYRKKQRPRI
jgi:hypothetical protein